MTFVTNMRDGDLRDVVCNELRCAQHYRCTNGRNERQDAGPEQPNIGGNKSPILHRRRISGMHHGIMVLNK